MDIDQYIQNAKEFARPVLIHIRELVRQTCPEVEEKIRWGFPHFDYHGILLSMAAFKEHIGLVFWKGNLMKDPYNVMSKNGEKGMGQFGKISSLDDLPSDEILKTYILEAMELNRADVKIPKKQQNQKNKELVIPDDFKQALDENLAARNTFNRFSYSQKKEYIDWVNEAKTLKTKLSRLNNSIEWLAEGKVRNWKYLKK